MRGPTGGVAAAVARQRQRDAGDAPVRAARRPGDVADGALRRAGMPPPMQPPMGPPPGVPGFTPGFAPATAAGMRRCPSCGSDVPQTFRFCGTCGFRMDEGVGPGGDAAARARPPGRAHPAVDDADPAGRHRGRQPRPAPRREQARPQLRAVFENDGYLSPVHAQLEIRGGTAMIRDLESLNGVFVKMTQEEELTNGQIIRIGQELLRFEVIAAPEPTADGTELMGSPNPGYWGKLTVDHRARHHGAAFPLLGDSCTLGRERGDINFPDDGYVSGLHARVALRDGRVSSPTSAARTARSSRSTASARSVTSRSCCSASSCSGSISHSGPARVAARRRLLPGPAGVGAQVVDRWPLGLLDVAERLGQRSACRPARTRSSR